MSGYSAFFASIPPPAWPGILPRAAVPAALPALSLRQG